MAANSKVNDAVYIRKVKLEAKKLLASLEYFSRVQLALNNGSLGIAAGSDPIQQFTDEEARALGFFDANTMQTTVVDLTNAVMTFSSASKSIVVAAANAGEL